MDNPSYYPNYYSLDDIIATQEKLECLPNADSSSLGYISSLDTLGTGDVDSNDVIELPMYLFNNLTLLGYDFDYKIPSTYNKEFKEICEADVNSIDLSKIGKYYYEMGLYITDDNNPDVGELLFKICRERCRLFTTACKNTTTEMKGINKLDTIENQIYLNGCETSMKIKNWLIKGFGHIEAATMVSNHKKRKRQNLIHSSKKSID